MDPIEAFHEMAFTMLASNPDMLVINNEHHALHLGDVGLNAELVKSHDYDENRGMLSYAKYFFEKLRLSEPFSITIEREGSERQEKAVMLAIGNARKCGTGIPINLEGDPTNGKFELVLIKELNAKLLIQAGLSALNEVFQNGENLAVFLTNFAKVRFDVARTLQLDGEFIGEFPELQIKILPRAVKLTITARNPYLPV